MKKHSSIIISIGLMLSACGTQSEVDVSNESSDPVVATSFYPLTFIAEQIGKDLVEIHQISAQGSDPHTYEPTPQQLQYVYNADLFLFNGQGQDAWADRIQKELEENSVNTLVATEIVTLMGFKEDSHEDHDEESHNEEHHDEHEGHGEEHKDEHESDEEESGHDHAEGHDHDHGEWDPHVWLDPMLVKQIAQTVTENLAQIDPENASEYEANRHAFLSQLDTLDNDMQAGLQNCELDSVIVSHDAFRYLANKYNFETLEIAGLSPSAEPSPARLGELTELAESRGINHIFFETHVSSALSNTLASEIGAQTLVLHSIEALTQEDLQNNRDYFDLMRQNLENLRTALQCS